MHPTQIEVLSFFEILKEELPDTRDNRGKRHNLAFVLTGVLLAILSGRSYPATIQRYLKNHFEALCEGLSYRESHPVSRAHLPRILQGVDWSSFNRLAAPHLGISIHSVEGLSWQSVDGKELRGSIEADIGTAKVKRGLSLVRIIDQESQQVRAQTFYHGKKESEKNAVRNLLTEHDLYRCKLSFDALHADPKTVSAIAQAQGSYLVQIKANQDQLYEELKAACRYLAPKAHTQQIEKGHGRIEQRSATCFDLSHPLFQEGLHPRWFNANIQTAILIERRFEIIKTHKIQTQTSIYITNEPCSATPQEKINEWAWAIRTHWAIESDNFIRDTTLREDHMKSTNEQIQKVMAVLRTCALEVLKKCKPDNFKALTETFADNPKQMFQILKNIHFL